MFLSNLQRAERKLSTTLLVKNHTRNRYPLPALILTATRMPYRDGMSLLAWIKQQPELKVIPVVMLSSTGEKRERERAEKLGVSCYLVKPPELDELIDLVEAIGLT